MKWRHAGLALAAALLYAGEPRPEAIQVECTCPIQVRGGKSLKAESTGRFRILSKGNKKVVSGADAAAALVVTVPAGIPSLDVVSYAGDVDIRQLKTIVRAQSGGGRVFLDGIQGSAEVRTGGGEIKVGRVDGNLKVLSGGNGIAVGEVTGETWCETAGGEIVVERTRGLLHATTGGGNIYVADAAAGVVARSDGGLIDVQRSAGVVDASTRGGSIQVGSAAGARCESAAGAIRLRNISGGVRAQTAMGTILAEILAGSLQEESSLVTGAGDITVLMPSNLSVTVRAISESRGRLARIISDFPEIRILGAQVWPLRSVAAEGALNGGGPVLHVMAGGGTVYLKRQR